MSVDPFWQPSLPTEQLDPQRIFWLTQRQSTTQLLATLYPEEALGVAVCYNGWGPAKPDEAHYLDQPSERYWIREVLLLINNTAWMWARSLLPVATLRAWNVDLTTLGDTPLGKVIFAEPNLKRSTFEFALIQPKHRLYYPSIEQHTRPKVNSLWARRSTFSLHQHAFLLTEVLLPFLPKTPK